MGADASVDVSRLHINCYSSFMLCRFGTSTETSAPVVLSFIVSIKIEFVLSLIPNSI